MKRAWPVLLLAVLPGCVTDEAAQNTAREAYGACTTAAVKRLDDGRSDPASIAMGVAGACSGQYAAFTNAQVETMVTEKSQAYMREQMRTEELRLATTAVLTYRASQRR